MKTRRRALSWACILVLLVGAAGCRAGTGSNARKLVGSVEVQGEEISGALPPRPPQTIYVADFTLDAEKYTGEEGVRGVLPGRLGQRLPHPLASDDPSEKARQIVETMAESLVQGLGAKGLTAQRLRDIAGSLPKEGWLVQGIFTEVDEGNRLKRAAIGFGKGTTSMDLQIGISDLAGPDPRAAFVVFGTVKDPGKLPGAVVTMNPYVAAAKFVLAKHATERDIKTTAEQIAEELLKYREQTKEHAKP
jgi:hypothetical protein